MNDDFQRRQSARDRILKIKSIEHCRDDAKKKKVGYAVASGIFFSSALVAMHFSGIDPDEALAKEIEALNSLDALKEFISMLTPAIYMSTMATVSSFSKFIQNRKKEKTATRELNDIYNTEKILSGVDGYMKNNFIDEDQDYTDDLNSQEMSIEEILKKKKEYEAAQNNDQTKKNTSDYQRYINNSSEFPDIDEEIKRGVK